MCGICGIVSNGPPVSLPMLKRMNEAIRRRGPDGLGTYIDGAVGLAMRRLAIIDVHGGQQPVFNETGRVGVVFNGEIYNYRELRAELRQRGHIFRTESDTEVIVHLYEEYGIDVATHLSGMFAFAIWDADRKIVVLGRDRLGIKPLYIAETHQGFVFGSEIKALLASGLVSRDLDSQALDEYLTYSNVPGPRTIYSAVKQIDAGTLRTISLSGNVQTHKYWSIPETIDDGKPEADWIVECERELRKSVESHLVSDVPVGAFLSGGVDSGLLVALMADILDRPVETFTVGFQGAGPGFIDERQYARQLAVRYNLRHHEIDVAPHLEDIIWEIVSAFDQPFADDSVVPSYYVSMAAASHVKVAITGLGGDELFGGYKRHLGVVLGGAYARVPESLRRWVVEPLVRRLPEARFGNDLVDHVKRFARADGDADVRYQDFLASMRRDERAGLYTPEFAEKVSWQETDDIVRVPFGQSSNGDDLARALRTDLKTYLADDVLTLTDRLSMWHSLEIRVPYLDHKFVEWVQGMPLRLRVKGLTQKYLLKRVAERWLPREMIYHRKQGFEAPMGQWLRGPLLPLFDELVNASAVASSGFFRFEHIAKLREEHVAGRRKQSKVLFALLMLFAWLQHNQA